MTIGGRREQRMYTCKMACARALSPSCVRDGPALSRVMMGGISGQGRPEVWGGSFFGSLGWVEEGNESTACTWGFFLPGRFDDQDLHSLFPRIVGLGDTRFEGRSRCFSRLPLAHNMCFHGSTWLLGSLCSWYQVDPQMNMLQAVLRACEGLECPVGAPFRVVAAEDMHKRAKFPRTGPALGGQPWFI